MKFLVNKCMSPFHGDPDVPSDGNRCAVVRSKRVCAQNHEGYANGSVCQFGHPFERTVTEKCWGLVRPSQQ